METRLVRLDDIADVNPTVSLAKDAEHPFVPMDAVTSGLRYVRAKWCRKLTGGARFHPGDTLMARITPCLENGKIAQFDPDGLPGFGSTEFIVLRAKPGHADPAYLFYLARSSILTEPAIASMSGASGRQRADAKVLAAVEFTCPGLAEQRRIASILSAYDDLIEVNRQRVALLEEAARSLFDEWFVRFCFPGHERSPLMETPDGPSPLGWEWSTAADVIEFDPRTKVAKDGLKPFISMGHLDTKASLIARHEMRGGNSGAKFRDGDTLFARITPCLENGKTGLVRDLAASGGVGFGSTEFIVMRGRRVGPAFTYCLARLEQFRVSAQQSMSGASGRQRAKADSVATFAMALPKSDELFVAFEQASWPMLELSGKLGEANQRLVTCRDLLLPRLMSGRLSVSAAEHELEAA